MPILNRMENEFQDTIHELEQVQHPADDLPTVTLSTLNQLELNLPSTHDDIEYFGQVIRSHMIVA